MAPAVFIPFTLQSRRRSLDEAGEEKHGGAFMSDAKALARCASCSRIARDFQAVRTRL